MIAEAVAFLAAMDVSRSVKPVFLLRASRSSAFGCQPSKQQRDAVARYSRGSEAAELLLESSGR